MVLAVGALFALLLILLMSISYQKSRLYSNPSRVPEENVLYVANLDAAYQHQDHLTAAYGLISWDMAVFENPSPDDTPSDFMNGIKDTTGQLITTNQSSTSSLEVRSTGRIKHIFLRVDDATACSIDASLLDKLSEELRRPAEFVIVYTNSLGWLDSKQLPLLSERRASESNCSESEWYKKVQPTLLDKVDIVVSPGSGYDTAGVGNVRYIISGVSEPRSSLLQLLRISIFDDKLVAAALPIADKDQITKSSHKSITDIQLITDEGELRNLYNQAQFYDSQKQAWFQLLEDDGSGLESISVKVTVEDGKQYDATLSTRGSLGNHWQGLKKSWNITYIDEFNEEIQLKLIIPEDKEYTNQLIVDGINNSPALNIISPGVSVANLTINSLDFGPYVMYEDFNKNFIELSKYGSDADQLSERFRDNFDFYPAWTNLNHLVKNDNNRPKEDLSLQQKALVVSSDPEQIKTWFDPGNYRPWIASSIYTGDNHQTSNDNTRFFLDRTTGRIVMVSWDQFLRELPAGVSTFNFPSDSHLQRTILGLRGERKKILAIVNQLAADRSQHQTLITSTNAAYKEVFANDPFAIESSSAIRDYIDQFAGRFDNNLQIIDDLAASND